MVFSSIEFLFYFLPIFLALYFALPVKNALFLAASLLFYAWGEAWYVLLLVGSGLINALLALWLERSQDGRRKLLLAMGVALNLLVLAAFKYLDFAVAAANVVLASLAQASLPLPAVHLPIGISFFTFQAISYLMDVSRRDIAAERNPANVLLYIAMFPHQLAGPIVRFGQVIAKLRERRASIDKFSLGTSLFVIGLAQKVLIANTVAVAADGIFALPTAELNAALAWLGAACYTLQIYFDFCGYSVMAAGLALMLGIYFPRNFLYPYTSLSITEFWRRWHISLSTWFRDYLYIPLGGNRHGPWRTYANLAIVFLLCGLWHGAAWTFVAWGAYHGALLVIERLGLGAWLEKWPRECRSLYTMLAVIIGWVLFRATSLEQFGGFVGAMAGFGRGEGIIHHVWQYLQPDVALALAWGAVAATPYFAKRIKLLSYWPQSDAEAATAVRHIHGGIALLLLSLAVLSITSIAAGNYNPFIYFRF